jgi:ketosteroid isomerase-like protein
MFSKNFIFVIGLLLVLSIVAMSQKQAKNIQSADGDVMSLVKIEREFAKTAAEIGVNDSFLKYFAPNGINFQPQPVVISEGKKDDTEKVEPAKIIFSWEPLYADIAQSGDLGYTTGPYEIRENTEERRILRGGFYFSVWQKQADNSWKVLLDMGVGTPLLPSAGDKKIIIAPQLKSKSNGKIATAEKLVNEINQIERQFSAASEKYAVKAYEKFARDDVRLHRFRILPVLGKEGVIGYVSEKEAKSSWETIKSGVSSSADFAWSYGTYKIIRENTADDETRKGYYLRVWRRDSENHWKLVAEITNPLKL